MFTPRLSPSVRRVRTVVGMSDHIPDPYLAQTGFDADFEDDDAFDFDADDADSELGIEEERAREN
jgi:hypothetical protein